MNQTMLTNHSTLLDLLEIPQLMDTYVTMINYVVTLAEFPAINCPTCCMYVKTYLHTLLQIVRNLKNSYGFAGVCGMEIMMKP